MATDVRAIQRTTRQSPYKMRLVIDQIRGKDVNEAVALLKFSKKHAAREIAKVLHSAVANAEHKARNANETVDVDTLFIKHAIVNEGPKLKRFTPAAMGRATQVLKRTSHVEIIVSERARSVKKVASAKQPTEKRSAAKRAPAKAKSAKPTSKKESK
jgi:large subunit ribosomal protein L22